MTDEHTQQVHAAMWWRLEQILESDMMSMEIYAPGNLAGGCLVRVRQDAMGVVAEGWGETLIEAMGKAYQEVTGEM